MATNLAIDDRLIEEARCMGGHSTKKQAVTVALEEYVAHRKQLAVLDLFGTIDFDKKYDYRRSRQPDRAGRDR
jgi:Arc/MetJ family transcription regulator